MTELQQQRSSLKAGWSLTSQAQTRRYFVWRGIVFLLGFCLVVSASFPNGPFSNPIGASFAGLAWICAFVVAYWFSKPALLAVFARPAKDRSLAVVKMFGLLGPLAYALGGYGWIDPDVINLIISICGGAFFLIYLSGIAIALRKPAVGAYVIKMVKEHETAKRSKT